MRKEELDLGICPDPELRVRNVSLAALLAHSDRRMAGIQLFSLEGKVALVTGSSKGLGKGMAAGLAAAGCHVVLNSRNAAECDSVAAEFAAEGWVCSVEAFDVTDEAAVDGAVARIAAAHGGRLDILVNNAGGTRRSPFVDSTIEDLDFVIDLNVRGPYMLARACARQMGKQEPKGGKIINIASVQTALARPGIAPYTATKGAVGNLTKGMATDWAKHGLQCNAIAPGYFDTPLNAALVADPEFSEWLAKRTPSGRWGKVEELVGAAVFLSSAASSFVNGHTLYVDGGITASL